MFKMKTETANDAFTHDYGKHEMARILRETAERIESGTLQDYIRDVNGSRIGHFSFFVDS